MQLHVQVILQESGHYVLSSCKLSKKRQFLIIYFTHQDLCEQRNNLKEFPKCSNQCIKIWLKNCFYFTVLHRLPPLSQHGPIPTLSNVPDLTIPTPHLSFSLLTTQLINFPQLYAHFLLSSSC